MSQYPLRIPHAGAAHTQASPVLVRSSKSYGWTDVEVDLFEEPLWMERWEEPVASDIMIKLILRGNVRVEMCDPQLCDGYHIEQGDLFLKPPGITAPPMRWQSKKNESTQSLHVRLSCSLLNRTIEDLVDRDPACIELSGAAGIQDPLILHVGLSLSHELIDPSPISTLYAQTASLMLAAHLLRYYTTTSLPIRERVQGLSERQIKRVREYIQAHLAEPLSLEMLAEQIGFSQYHFTRLFRLSFGESPHQYVLRQRVGLAQHLLYHTDMPISIVALESGFAHQSHLTQAFKRYVGMTPRAFRMRV